MPVAAQTEPAPAAPVVAPATTPAGGDLPRDRFEGFNRVVWGFNQGVDRIILKPVSSVYRTVAPRPARRGLTRVFANLSEPWSAINALLQGKPKRALNSLGRFVINTTIGVGGLADHATGMGLKPTPEDFGQTLATWGLKSSAYLVLPILGPSTVRDGIGSGVAQFADPYRVCLRECGLPNGVPTALTVLEVVNTRAVLTESGVDGFLKSSADPYATARSAYLQRRAAAIADQDDDSPGTTVPGNNDAAMEDALKELGGDAPADPAPTEQPAPDASGTAAPTTAEPAPPPAPPETSPAGPKPTTPQLVLFPVED
jgi:phospholipid-binding lipoprotein MlaA